MYIKEWGTKVERQKEREKDISWERGLEGGTRERDVLSIRARITRCCGFPEGLSVGNEATCSHIDPQWAESE